MPLTDVNPEIGEAVLREAALAQGMREWRARLE